MPALLTPARIGVAGTIGIVALSFVLSFAALTDLADRAGVAYPVLWPLIVDGLIVVATVAVVALRTSRYAWCLLGAGAAVSIAGNVVHALLPDGEVAAEVDAAVALVPPLALLAVAHLTVILIRSASTPAAPVASLEHVEPGDDIAEYAAEYTDPDLREWYDTVPTPSDYVPTFEHVAEQPAVAVPVVESTPAPTLVDVEPSTRTPNRQGDERRAYAESLIRSTGRSNYDIAAEVGVSEATVRRWRRALVDA